MKSVLFGGILFVLFALSACTTDAPPSQTDNVAGADTTAVQPTPTPEPMPDCALPGQVLEGNTVFVRQQGLLLVIRADESTRDPELGESHRVVELYEAASCNRVFQQTLPVNVSPDFPYFVADILYNNGSQLVGIRGFNTVYVLDLNARQMLPKLSPRYFAERPQVDAQSGMIQRLEVWEDYFIGYAQDEGVFAFDFSNRTQPQAVLPLAEYASTEDQEYSSLFLLPIGDNGKMQGLIPYYDIESDDFALNPIFPEPMSISTNIPKSARNNRYLVLRPAGANPTEAYAVDLVKRSPVSLPADIQAKSTQDILSWIRANVR